MSSVPAFWGVVGVSIVLCCLLAGAAVAIRALVALHQRHASMHGKGLPRAIPRWQLGKGNTFACFLSHYKKEAGAEARFIKDLLEPMLGEKVFLDRANLTDLRTLFDLGVRRSDVLILLATRNVLTRPYCLMELWEASRAGIPIIIVAVAGAGFDLRDAYELLTNLNDELPRRNANALRELEQLLAADDEGCEVLAGVGEPLGDTVARGMQLRRMLGLSVSQSDMATWPEPKRSSCVNGGNSRRSKHKRSGRFSVLGRLGAATHKGNTSLHRGSTVRAAAVAPLDSKSKKGWDELRDRQRRGSVTSNGFGGFKTGVKEDKLLTWHPHGSDNVLVADASDLVQHMAGVVGAKMRLHTPVLVRMLSRAEESEGKGKKRRPMGRRVAPEGSGSSSHGRRPKQSKTSSTKRYAPSDRPTSAGTEPPSQLGSSRPSGERVEVCGQGSASEAGLWCSRMFGRSATQMRRTVYVTYSGMQAWIEAPLLVKALQTAADFRRDVVFNASDTWNDASLIHDVGRMRFAADVRRRHLHNSDVVIWIQTRESLADVFLLLDLFWAMHRGCYIVCLNLSGGGYDHHVAKAAIKKLPETLGATDAAKLLELQQVPLDRLQAVVAIATTSILSIDFRGMRTLSPAATEALSYDIAQRLHTPPPPLPPELGPVKRLKGSSSAGAVVAALSVMADAEEEQIRDVQSAVRYRDSELTRASQSSLPPSAASSHRGSDALVTPAAGHRGPGPPDGLSTIGEMMHPGEMSGMETVPTKLEESQTLCVTSCSPEPPSETSNGGPASRGGGEIDEERGGA